MCCETTFRVIPYFLSQYLIFIVIMLSFSISNQSTSNHFTSERYCSPSKGENWSDDYDPDYFYHITDVHITHYIQSTVVNFETSLKIGALYKSKSVLITGDLVDNYFLPYYPSQIQETKQMPEDWLRYFSMANKYSKSFEKIIESFGNHDVPRILSKNADNFFYSKNTMSAKNHQNFDLPNETYDVFTDKVGNFTFLVLNPIFFPIPPLPFTYYIHAPTEYINKVENVIKSIPDDENVILSTHYQGPVWSKWYIPFVKSKSTNVFFSSILQNPKIKMLLTGHNHGANRMIMHYDDSFEICASDLRYSNKSGLVTNDNGNIVYHWFSIFKPTRSFVTFPAPIEQTTSRTDCGIQKVRVISFNSANATFSVEIDGIQHELKRVRELNHNKDAWLLEADLTSLPTGKHHLKLIGEDEEEFDFLFGPSSRIESATEPLYDDMLWASRQWIGLIILAVIFLTATFPVSFCRSFNFDGYWRWVNKIDASTESEVTDSTHGSIPSLEDTELPMKPVKRQSMRKDGTKYWIFSVLFGFLGIRSRLMKLPFPMRMVLFVSVFASLFLPIFTFDVGGRFGFMFIFGYLLGQGKGSHLSSDADFSVVNYISRVYGSFELRFEEWCPFLGFFYFAVAVVPVILFASSLGLKPKNENESWLQLIDFLVLIGSLVGGLTICFDAFLLLCERKCAILSPFVLFPLVWLIAFTIFFFIRRRERIAVIYPNQMLAFINEGNSD